MSDGKIRGAVHQVGDVQTFGEKFRKVEIVIDTGGQYPQYIPCEAATARLIDTAGGLSVGDVVDVEFYLRGREWKDRYFSSVRIASIDPVSGSGERATPPPASTTADQPAPATGDDQEGLPF